MTLPDAVILQCCAMLHSLLILPMLFIASFSHSENQRQAIISDAPETIVMENEEEITLHKVWKYKTFNTLPHMFADGSGIYGIRPFTTLDLRDKSTFRYNTHKKKRMRSASYQIRDNAIVMEQVGEEVKFKISRLTADELVLTVHIEIEEGEVNIEGDMVELVYIATIL